MSRGRGAILDDLPTKNLFTDGSVERKMSPEFPGGLFVKHLRMLLCTGVIRFIARCRSSGILTGLRFTIPVFP